MQPTPPTLEQFDSIWLPERPLATDELIKGIYRMSRESALTRRYIEANPLALSNLLVVDIDHSDALLRALWDRKDTLPNCVVETRTNGHAHAVWALSEPITRTEFGSRKAVAYAASVAEGLRRSVDGDKSYSGLMTKNPLHTDWDAHWITDELRTLDELATWLDSIGVLPPKSWRRTRRKNPVGLGRNCYIFETARTWAYREIRHHFGNPEGLACAISCHVHELNAGFADPLPVAEAEQIARSITRWIITKSRMWRDGAAVYEANFINIQSTRGKKSGESRRTTQKELIAFDQERNQ